MDSKTFNSIIGFWLNIAVILTLLLCLALSVINTIYYKKLADDNGSTSISYDTANSFYAVNLVLSIMTFLVLIMYFFKSIVVTIFFMIFLILTVTGIVAVSITNTIYYKKLWDDNGSMTNTVSGKTGKLLFFFNLTLSIVSLIVFLIFLYRWYNVYNVVQEEEKSMKKTDMLRNVRGYNMEVRNLTPEEIRGKMYRATTPKVRQRFSPRGYNRLSPIDEEIPDDEQEKAMITGTPLPKMMSPPINPDNSPNIFSPYVGNENTILKDKSMGSEIDIYPKDEDIVSENTIRTLDFGKNDQKRTYQVIGSYESVSDYI